MSVQRRRMIFVGADEILDFPIQIVHSVNVAYLHHAYPLKERSTRC